MKSKKDYLFTLLCVTTLSPLLAQNLKVAEPEFSGNAVYVDGANSEFGLPLETMNSSRKTKAGASVYLVGAGKIHTDISVKGTTSGLKIKEQEKIQFIYKAENNTVNPKEIIQLIRFRVKGKNRVAEIASIGTFTGASSGDLGYINFQATKYGTSSYLITVSNLTPGEYGFSFGKETTKLVHMFNITSQNSSGFIQMKNSTPNNSDLCIKYLKTKKVGKQILIGSGIAWCTGTILKLTLGLTSPTGNVLQNIGILGACAGLTVNLIGRSKVKNNGCALKLNLTPSNIQLAYNF
jgi:hypothetical protein